MTLTPSQFVERWRGISLSERSAAQSHFLDLCRMLGEPHPVEADAVGERFTFEKHVSRTSGGKGFADVWLRDHFAWEYKGKHKDLAAAYKQLNDYREDLLNPPLLVVCDMNCFEVHTNFGKTKKRVYKFDLRDLELNQITANCPHPPLEVFQALFHDTDRLRPERTDAFVTQEAARVFARMAERLEIEKRSLTDTPIATKEEISHFLLRLLFCLFADNIGLLPKHVFRRLIDSDDRFTPRIFLRKLRGLFNAMAKPDGIFGEHTIKHFNGGLFDNASVVALDKTDLALLHEVATRYDWSRVAPAIFGTLFERSLDPARRSLVGAHYTSEADILLLVEPVVIQPIRARWEQTKTAIVRLLEHTEVSPMKVPIANRRQRRRGASPPSSLLTPKDKAENLLAEFFKFISSVRVLDPACGSGNFLYVALRKLLDLWLEARDFAVYHNLRLATQYAADHMVSPSQLFGIEVDYYAHELASVVVWIGFIQWKMEHGVFIDRQPILEKLTNIEQGDAILRYNNQTKQPYEPSWPPADFIVGNPPFLGGGFLRRELGGDYVDALYKTYAGRVLPQSDLVTYWFEKARGAVEANRTRRAGLLATQGIRGGVNRKVLERIKASGDIFMAWSDRDWTLEGAAVHISMIGFDDGSETLRVLDGKNVESINADLTDNADTTSALPLIENRNLCFRANEKGGPFEINPDLARRLLAAPLNINGRPNSDVLSPWVNASDITGRSRGLWIIDFKKMTKEQAAAYEMPFEYLRRQVKREKEEAIMNGKKYHSRITWWLHRRSGSEMLEAVVGLRRYVATPRVAKHRTFVWLQPGCLPDNALYVFARDDDYFFGVLHSHIHETWGLHMGTQLEDRPRYTPNSTFDTFPLPWAPGTEPSEDESPIVKAIADAARNLVRLRNAWLSPPDASQIELRERTLTNLYNKRPAWLDSAHESLDRAVFAAYGLAYPLTRNEILHFLLTLNRERAAGHVRVLAPELPPKKAQGVERTPKPVRLGKIASR